MLACFINLMASKFEFYERVPSVPKMKDTIGFKIISVMVV